ncbi:MAG: hypothetical protein L0Y68_09410 [Candidatus Dadabacteria bacterium]|nr:hypothetical protein [Candidatus Dadabacteria bacterium]
MMAEFMPKSNRVLSQAISQDSKTATLKLVGISTMNNKETYGNVSLVKEVSWKIDTESWSNTQK